jgi:hypothetical protein
VPRQHPESHSSDASASAGAGGAADAAASAGAAVALGADAGAGAAGPAGVDAGVDDAGEGDAPGDDAPCASASDAVMVNAAPSMRAGSGRRSGVRIIGLVIAAARAAG